MYEKLLAKIYDLIPERREASQYYTAKVLQESADAIEELANWWSMAKMLSDMVVPKWIPVTKRLPEDMCNVLVTDGENVGMGWLDYYTRKDTGAVECDWFAPNTPVKESKITHWKPLPGPPKEEQI